MTELQSRHYTLADRLLLEADKALRTISGTTQAVTRPSPATNCKEPSLSESDRQHAAGLMRVNHTGEVCAQALYQGQALTANLEQVRQNMQRAAAEEIDHLQWCDERLKELGSQASFLNPLWYTLSFGLGASAGLIGDKISLGFVAATEEQVSKHLENHLQTLPQDDKKSRAIVEQMLVDERKHGHSALDAGGTDFPAPIKSLMTAVSKVMTKLSYRL
jgi:ubiquinone biosynthesis monooxygenase Coq7